ncbi:MAG TPA: twin-arginine translocation signal domain-containing protein [Pyrinomonadaceae bacterium]
MDRRDFIKAGAALTMVNGLGGLAQQVPSRTWDDFNWGSGPVPADRLNQGPFGIEQDEGWYTVLVTSQSDQPVRNYGLGLVGYSWEEGGPSLAARQGKESLEKHVENLSSLPFVDVLYIRCDWRDVQTEPGKLNLNPVFKLTLDAAKKRNQRVGFRVQMSNTEFQPTRLALPDFLQKKVPLVKVGKTYGSEFQFVEPRYDHPAFQTAFRELNELLVSEFDGNPLMEFVDLMMYGFWGEGHTSNLPNPFPDYMTAEKTFVDMTELQLELWKKVPLAVNTQPDISSVGNTRVLDMCVRADCWLRSDSIIIEEPIQIEQLSNRPPWLAIVMEDGYYRQYKVDPAYIPADDAGINVLEKWMLHSLDLGANYWSLWTESENLALYNERYPRGFETLRKRIGYRVRPSWVWQRKRYGTNELIVAIANDGVAGVPGILRVFVESIDGKVKIGGALDAGHPHGGKLRQASFVLPKNLDGQKMKIRAELETKGGIRRPVHWASAQPPNTDGSLTIELLRADDKRWRKGV